RAVVNRLVEEDSFVIVLCNQGDAFGQTEIWNTVQNLSRELTHIVTNQPYRMPRKPRPSQDQRMYAMVKAEGAAKAANWFRENGRKAPWGGSTLALSEKLLQEGRVDDAIHFLEMEIELNPGKVWLYRKAAEACLSHERSELALELAIAGLDRKPDDEKLQTLRKEAEDEASPIKKD
ncbi:MAG: tetratricopeptide repeat protein, partial [Verrucomicrobiota bacterium]